MIITPSTNQLSEDIDILSHSSVFSGIPFEVVQLFAYLAKRKQYLKDEYIIKKDKEAGGAYILVEGSVDIILNHNNKNHILQTLEKGTFFGELALLARFNWFFNARAKTDSDLIILERASFQNVLDKFPAHREKMTERIVQLRIQRLSDQTSHMLDTFMKIGLDSQDKQPTSFV